MEVFPLRDLSVISTEKFCKIVWKREEKLWDCQNVLLWHFEIKFSLIFLSDVTLDLNFLFSVPRASLSNWPWHLCHMAGGEAQGHVAVGRCCTGPSNPFTHSQALQKHSVSKRKKKVYFLETNRFELPKEKYLSIYLPIYLFIYLNGAGRVFFMGDLREGCVSYPCEVKPVYETLNLSVKQQFYPWGPQKPMRRVYQQPSHGQEKHPLSTRCKEKEWGGRGWRSDFA